MSLTVLSRRLVLLLVLSLMPALDAAARDLPKDTLTITTRSGGEYRFTVELARTDAEQHRGLMFREQMADDAGMLFLYEDPEPASFWMKNTLIPLDMLFIDKDGTIANIHENAKPHDLTPIRAVHPVTGILEINGGLAARLGIRAGDRVVYKNFK
jgi:uncharacterized membrane protein (UPF0127 family)